MRWNRERSVLLIVVLATGVFVVRHVLAGLVKVHGVYAQGTLAPQPMQMKGFPYPAATVNGWVAKDDQTDIRKHGWDLWAGITAVTAATNGYPTWETWYSDGEVDAGPPASGGAARFAMLRSQGKPAHDFHAPRQFHLGRTASLKLSQGIATPNDVTSFNKFNLDYSNFVWSNNYQNTSTLWNLQASWGTTTPVVNRVIQPFPSAAIGLKPVFQVVNGPTHNNGVTVVNYWLGDLTTGPSNSSNPANPTPSTWNQCVVVSTVTPVAPAPASLQCTGSGNTPSGTVSVSSFYSFPLTAAEVTSICKEQGDCTVQVGDYAILVAMHMTTRENDHWTWQTFWWNYNQPFPYGGPPSSVVAPFNNYAMCTGYSMTTNPPNSPRGKNVLCYNPYLETGLGGGVQGVNSDCMTCHMVASLGNNPNTINSGQSTSPANSGGYPTFIKGTSSALSVWSAKDDKVFFDCQTTTDFSWFLADNANGKAPTQQPTCLLTPVASSKPGKPTVYR